MGLIKESIYLSKSQDSYVNIYIKITDLFSDFYKKKLS